MKKGFTFIEIAVTMAVIAILSAAVMGMISTGTQAFNRSREDSGDEASARTAMTLITTQLRRHDEIGGVKLEGQKLIFYNSESAGDYNEIWLEDGTLKFSAPGGSGGRVTADIARINGLSISQPERVVGENPIETLWETDTSQFEVAITYGDKGRSLRQTVYLRSRG